MTTRVVIGKIRVTVVLEMITSDVEVLAPASDLDHDGHLTEGEITATSHSLAADVAARLSVTNNGTSVRPATVMAQIASVDPVTNSPHDLVITVTFTLPNFAEFEKLVLDPNLFREIPDRPLAYKTPPEGSQTNRVTIFDCDVMDFETSGTRKYETIVGKCE